MCTTLKNKKVECFCYIFNRIALGDIVEETKIDKSGLTYADVKCECGNLHSIVTNKVLYV